MKWFNPTFFAQMNCMPMRALNKFINNCEVLIKVPKSTRFHHNGYGSVVGEGVKLGNNVTIFQNVLLGKNIFESKDGGFPTVEDNVIICPNCTVVGKITIGKNSIIGTGSYIDKDIPPNTFVYPKQELIMKTSKYIQDLKEVKDNLRMII